MPDRSIHEHIAHDLKAALSPIQTAAYVLRRGDALPQRTTTELAAVIERQTQRLARMIDEASEWQRAVEGRLSLRPEDIAPVELMDASISGLDGSPRVQWNGSSNASFRGDSYRLQQMLAALLGYACRRDPARSPTVEVTVGDDSLAWTITDAGLPCDTLALFSRPHDAGNDEGLGLGLLRARAIATAHGGDLEASEPDSGGLRLHCQVRSLTGAPD